MNNIKVGSLVRFTNYFYAFMRMRYNAITDNNDKNFGIIVSIQKVSRNKKMNEKIYSVLFSKNQKIYELYNDEITLIK